MKLTKKKFWDMIDSKQMDLRSGDTCLYNGAIYSIKCDDVNNSVKLDETDG